MVIFLLLAIVVLLVLILCRLDPRAQKHVGTTLRVCGAAILVIALACLGYIFVVDARTLEGADAATLAIFFVYIASLAVMWILGLDVTAYAKRASRTQLGRTV